jgi:chemotaxis protein histidine kinase CheA
MAYEDWEEVSTADGFSDLAGRGGDIVSNSINQLRNILQ